MFGGWRNPKDEELWDRLLGDAPFILLVIVAFGGATYFLVEEFRSRSRVNESAIARCIQQGNSDAECERRVEEHATLCYRFSRRGGVHRSGPFLDTNVYDRCLKLGKEAYLEQVAKESRERRREKQRMKEKYGLPP